MKKHWTFTFLSISIIFILLNCSRDNNISVHYGSKYISPDTYEMTYQNGNWEHPNYTNPFTSYGNHRIIIEVEDPSKGIVQVNIPWRRKDNNPQDKEVLIIDTLTNTPITNKHVLTVNNEHGHLIFEPIQNSTRYYVYYLPHSSTGGYYPKLHYQKPADHTSDSWFSKLKLTEDQLKDLPNAKIIRAQSIDEFHSFFPMEIIATKQEVTSFMERSPKPYYLFPEYRERPIKMEDYLPLHWVSAPELVNGISDSVMRGEYYTFQIGVFAPEQNLEDVKVDFTDLEGDYRNISNKLITSFNTEGVDLNAMPFKKTLNVNAGTTQAIWFGIEIPEDQQPGSYLGQFVITPKGLSPDTVYMKLEVISQVIANYGNDHPENMSRMRWLNSTIGRDKDFILNTFIPVKVANKTIHILGRDVELNEYGLPEKISSNFTQEMTNLKDEPEEMLAQPIQFNILNPENQPEEWTSAPYTINQSHQSEVNWETTNSSETFTMNISGSLEYDGMLDYQIKLIAKKDVEVSDIKLMIPLEQDAAKYMLGLGFKGGKTQQNIAWKWDVTKHQEGAWLGNINKGLQFVLRDDHYERPLNTNFYQNKPLNLPTSWYNEGKGGINIVTENEFVYIENYSGLREVFQGDTLHFYVRFLITPFKVIDLKEHFTTRFVHKYVPVDSVVKWNGTIINVHHANEINPYINYPFYNVGAQKAYIEEAHSKGIKVKLYNTIRELSYKAYELFALRSLGDEILNDGEGGGHSWLQEHMKSNYHSAWHATRVNDAAILNKGSSRWTNYYIEGINWLAKVQKIDGLYLDDIAFSRTTVKRIANVLSKNRGTYVIDLHSANQYNHRDGFINSAFLYMEHFPYVSRLWFGEYFEYDLAPDYWLTEVSGIPFGLTGEMLEKGGHPYRGLVYGMTTRIYGNYSPEAIWKLFDDFDIANSEMLGYWVERAPIKTDTKGIKSTIYVHPDKVLIAIGSWSSNNQNVTLNVDWKVLGIDKSNARIYSPEIKGLQRFQSWEIDKPISVAKEQGLILILETN